MTHQPKEDGYRYYGCWGGNPKGTREDRNRCIERVCSQERGSIPYQCQRKRGHGPDGLYCKQHDPAAVKAKNDAQRAKWDLEAAERHEKWRKDRLVPKAIDLLRSIANGHNDARTAAIEFICEYDNEPNGEAK